jgi:hypothetical protein
VKKCPFCAEEINDDAVKCRYCGEFLTSSVKDRIAEVSQGPHETWSPGVAALLSFLIPGAGQIYKGNTGGGILWLIAVLLGYILFVIPGVILHIICIVSAASSDRKK